MNKADVIAHLQKNPGGYSIPGVDNNTLAGWLLSDSRSKGELIRHSGEKPSSEYLQKFDRELKVNQTSNPDTVHLRVQEYGQQLGIAEKTISPTANMTIEERILHVGGRNNAEGYVEFGSVHAVIALIRQVLRDNPDQRSLMQNKTTVIKPLANIAITLERVAAMCGQRNFDQQHPVEVTYWVIPGNGAVDQASVKSVYFPTVEQAEQFCNRYFESESMPSIKSVNGIPYKAKVSSHD
jgi:hypothetical protein